MTRQLVWIDTEKERVVPVEPTPGMVEPFARRECVALGLDPDEPCPPHGEYPRWYGNGAVPARLLKQSIAAAPPSTPVSLPSEEEFCEFWAWEIDELDFNTLPETDKDRVDGFGACKDDYREYYRAIRKLLTEKGEKNGR